MAELQKSFRASSGFSVSLVVLMLWLNITARASIAITGTVRVGVILDLNSTLGKMVHNSLYLAIGCYYSDSCTDTKIDLIVRSIPQNDVVAAADAAFDLIEKHGVRALLGPQNSEQARYIVKLGKSKKVPVIWFPITGPSLLSPPSPSSIYSEQGEKYCYQFHAIGSIINALGWQSVVPIYEKTEYGSYLIPCLANILKDKGIRIVNVTAIDSDSTDYEIVEILDKLKSLTRQVFLVHMSMDFGTRFIVSAEDRNMMGEGYAWILTQELSSLTNPRNYLTGKPLKQYMQGALGVRPKDLISSKTIVRRKEERFFKTKLRSDLTMYGWWAYHTLEALAMALEKPGTYNNGQNLSDEIRATNFTGNSGIYFNLNQEQLDQSEFEAYNVIGQRERIIGSWNPKTALDQKHNGNGDETSSEYPLKDPLWPGDTLDKPPKLMIGVPTTNFSPELVNVDLYNSSKSQIYGFAINVFLKAVDVLPFRLNNYELVPLPNEGRIDTMTYDNLLCSQMKDKDLDAIIGDITIVENRTQCVDFTLPYLDSSVVMVVRVTNTSSKWILFKPFKWSLWLILGGIFAAATIIIILLNINNTKQGNKTKEFLCYNPFLVYKLDVMENFKSEAGWMVILTSFLFILVVQVYTANLTSILTQGTMKEPLFKDESEIISRNLSVGYRKGSWVEGLLIEQIGVKSYQLKALRSREEYNEALLNGTEHGGVDAIFDETPYLTLFLSKYKSYFMMTGSIYKTGGFAFAFPKKSGLASHFSTAILKVTQDVEHYRVLMAKSSLPTSIEDLEFEDQSDRDASSLTVDNFGGLRTVILSVVALFFGLSIPLAIKWSHKNLPLMRPKKNLPLKSTKP